MAHGLPLVGGGRVPGLRRRAQSKPAGCRRLTTLDFSIVRPWKFRKYRFVGGLKVYNAFANNGDRDVQNNITSPDYGTFYNPIKRSIGFVFGTPK